MTLGASALGQLALGGGAEAVAVNYVDCEAQISITSQIQSSISIAGRVDIAAAIAIGSSIQSSITIIPAVAGAVNISASIAMQSSLTAALTATIDFPNAGVSFTLSDKAGGA
jgi:hypothetical protein